MRLILSRNQYNMLYDLAKDSNGYNHGHVSEKLQSISKTVLSSVTLREVKQHYVNSLLSATALPDSYRISLSEHKPAADDVDLF